MRLNQHLWSTAAVLAGLASACTPVERADRAAARMRAENDSIVVTAAEQMGRQFRAQKPGADGSIAAPEPLSVDLQQRILQQRRFIFAGELLDSWQDSSGTPVVEFRAGRGGSRVVLSATTAEAEYLRERFRARKSRWERPAYIVVADFSDIRKTRFELDAELDDEGSPSAFISDGRSFHYTGHLVAARLIPDGAYPDLTAYELW